MIKKISVVLLVGLGVLIYVTTIEETEGVLNINTAEISDFQRFFDIDIQTARNIVIFRNTNGPFRSVEDLLMVSGIKKETLQKIRKNLVIEGETTIPSKDIHTGTWH